MIEGDMSATESPDSMPAPTLSQAYFATAGVFMQEADVSLSGSPVPTHTLTMSCGLIVELSLKAFLAAKPLFTENKVRGHDLRCLWRMAARECLPGIAADMPKWAEQLHAVYARPYALRYGKGHGITLPNMAAMRAGTRELFDTVGKAVGA